MVDGAKKELIIPIWMWTGPYTEERNFPTIDTRAGVKAEISDPV